MADVSSRLLPQSSRSVVASLGSLAGEAAAQDGGGRAYLRVLRGALGRVSLRGFSVRACLPQQLPPQVEECVRLRDQPAQMPDLPQE